MATSPIKNRGLPSHNAGRRGPAPEPNPEVGTPARATASAAVIMCTADPSKADKRTRSKWSRLMRYAAVYKPDSEALGQFIYRKGGINACAARFSRCLGRTGRRDVRRENDESGNPFVRFDEGRHCNEFRGQEGLAIKLVTNDGFLNKLPGAERHPSRLPLINTSLFAIPVGFAAYTGI
jgi:hypothetical protein